MAHHPLSVVARPRAPLTAQLTSHILPPCNGGIVLFCTTTRHRLPLDVGCCWWPIRANRRSTGGDFRWRYTEVYYFLDREPAFFGVTVIL